MDFFKFRKRKWLDGGGFPDWRSEKAPRTPSRFFYKNPRFRASAVQPPMEWRMIAPGGGTDRAGVPKSAGAGRTRWTCRNRQGRPGALGRNKQAPLPPSGPDGTEECLQGPVLEREEPLPDLLGFLLAEDVGGPDLFVPTPGRIGGTKSDKPPPRSALPEEV